MVEPRFLFTYLKQFQMGAYEPLSKLGYFCSPFVADDGLWKGKVVKIFRGSKNIALVQEISARHALYIDTLRAYGIHVPHTEMHIARKDDKSYLIIVQDFFESGEMLRDIILNSPLDVASKATIRCLETIDQFWSSAVKAPPHIGFHASIRNFAIRKNKLWFLDTFPPLIEFRRTKIHKIAIHYTRQRWCRFLGPFALSYMPRLTDDWYSRIDGIVGAVGSVCRLRPGDSEKLLLLVREYVKSDLPASDIADLLSRLETPPRLPPIWVIMRVLLGTEGKPNVTFPRLEIGGCIGQ